jgi:hypothetical protein
MTENAESKVLLTLENGVIVAKRYRFVSGGVLGITAFCDDGTWKLYAVGSPRRCQSGRHIDFKDLLLGRHHFR